MVSTRVSGQLAGSREAPPAGMARPSPRWRRAWSAALALTVVLGASAIGVAGSVRSAFAWNQAACPQWVYGKVPPGAPSAAKSCSFAYSGQDLNTEPGAGDWAALIVYTAGGHDVPWAIGEAESYQQGDKDALSLAPASDTGSGIPGGLPQSQQALISAPGVASITPASLSLGKAALVARLDFNHQCTAADKAVGNQCQSGTSGQFDVYTSTSVSVNTLPAVSGQQPQAPPKSENNAPQSGPSSEQADEQFCQTQSVFPKSSSGDAHVSNGTYMVNGQGSESIPNFPGQGATLVAVGFTPSCRGKMWLWGNLSFMSKDGLAVADVRYDTAAGRATGQRTVFGQTVMPTPVQLDTGDRFTGFETTNGPDHPFAIPTQIKPAATDTGKLLICTQQIEPQYISGGKAILGAGYGRCASLDISANKFTGNVGWNLN